MTNELLTTVEAAKLLRVGPATLNRWRWDGTGPPFVKLGRKVFFQRETLDRWVAEQRQPPQR
jgi:excisionase family DNA binding protein